MAKARIAINGFGRIGRLFFRAAFGSPDIEIVAINDLGDVENLAYLLKYDTVYGRYGKEIKTDLAKGNLIVGGKEIKFLQIKDPAQLPWKDLAVDIVIESTGLFESYEKSKVHIIPNIQTNNAIMNKIMYAITHTYPHYSLLRYQHLL